MSTPNDSSIDRALRYAPWAAGVLVGLCLIALVVRVAVRANKSADRQERATAYQAAVKSQTAHDNQSRSEAPPASESTPETTRKDSSDNTPSHQQTIVHRQVLKEPESPRAKSRLEIHGGRVLDDKAVRKSTTSREGGAPTKSTPTDAFRTQPPSAAAEQPRASGTKPLAGLSLDTSGRTSFFGIEAAGQRFVYVFDRSSSMGVPKNQPLRAAKDELLASLSKLDSVNQFFLIFYNQGPVVFNPTGVSGRLVFATDLNKQSARSFVESVSAEGGTNHYAALRVAVGLHPDVIFLLTDGEPQDDLSADELADLKRLNVAAARIYVIQFAGSAYAANSLVRLAEENRGEHKYVDIRSPSSQP